MDPLRHFREVWCVDFEFGSPAGERPQPRCVVAHEMRTRRTKKVWLDGVTVPTPPYDTGPESLFVAYYASAELSCHLALGWPMPERIVDLYAEFRCRTAGRSVPARHGLLGALTYFGLPGLAAAAKDAGRQMAMRGGPYTDIERVALLDYCATDVVALARLLPVMLPRIHVPQALLRGRFMAAAARMEWAGTPIDVEALTVLRNNWEQLKNKIVVAVNKHYGVYVPVRSRTLNPATPFGSAVLTTAADHGIDPYNLADAADVLYRQECVAYERTREALRDARRSTGLTLRQASFWEDAGQDHASWPGLDVAARELAGRWPDLNIGHGYDPDAPDDDDHAGRLWDRLREPTPVRPRRHDPDLLRRAAGQVLEAGPTVTPAGPWKFSAARWVAYMARRGIAWPTGESGAPDLCDDTFKEMAKCYPAEVGPIRELRQALSRLRLNDLAVGSDGRNRCLLSAFKAKTSRNQPSNSKFIFGPSVWQRSLIRPGPGRMVLYCDWEQQEFALAAWLSKDRAMMAAYETGDPYLAFAKQAGAVPLSATKQSHRVEREQFKVCALGVQYGMSASSLACRLNVSPYRGRELLRLHQQTYSRYWAWSEAVQDRAMLTGQLSTVFGWTLHVGRDVNPRSLRNFPVQGGGAEMLRLAACLATERGLMVCAPVHDALLVEGPATYSRTKKDPSIRLRAAGATEEEAAFLVERRTGTSTWSGRRVELNALTSPRFIEFLEHQFAAVGVTKVMPTSEALARAYRRAWGTAELQDAIDRVTATLDQGTVPKMPRGLARRIAERIKGTDQSWDEALADVAREQRRATPSS
jgi:hypothetical protein